MCRPASLSRRCSKLLVHVAILGGCSAESLDSQTSRDGEGQGKGEQQGFESEEIVLEPGEERQYEPPCKDTHSHCFLFLHIDSPDPEIELVLKQRNDDEKISAHVRQRDLAYLLPRAPIAGGARGVAREKRRVTFANHGAQRVSLRVSTGEPVDWEVEEVNVHLDGCPLVINSELVTQEKRDTDARCDDTRPIHQRGQLTVEGFDRTRRRVFYGTLRQTYDVEAGVASAGDRYESIVKYVQGSKALSPQEVDQDSALSETEVFEARSTRTGALVLRPTGDRPARVTHLAYALVARALQVAVVDHRKIFAECAWSLPTYITALGGGVVANFLIGGYLEVAGIAAGIIVAVEAAILAVGTAVTYAFYMTYCTSQGSRQAAESLGPPPQALPKL